MQDRLYLRNRIMVRLFGGRSGKVFRGMVTLALGSGIGQIIGIATIPILTRLYSPEDFGALAVYTALVMTLAPLATLRYALALPLPRHDGIAINMLALSTVLMLGLTGLYAVALWLWATPMLAMVSMEVLAPFWWLIALGVLGAATYELLTMWATRRRAYKLIAETNVIQSATGALAKIGFGFAALQPTGLLVGQVMAHTGGTGRLTCEFWIEMRMNWHHVRLKRMLKAGRRYRGFPIWRAPSQFLMVFSAQAPMLFMAGLYDAETTGQFAVAVMALMVPVNLVGQSAGSALYGEASMAIKTDRSLVLEMCKETQIRLLILTLPCAAVIIFAGQYLFELLFGEKWYDAGLYASALSIGLVFQLTSAPLIQVMNLLAKQYMFLFINMIRLLGLVSVFSFAFLWNLDSFQTVLFFSIFSAIFYISVSLFVLRSIKGAVR